MIEELHISARARSVSYEVRTPRGVFWVTHTIRTAPLVPGEHWHCTCCGDDCGHIPAVQEWLAQQAKRREQAA